MLKVVLNLSTLYHNLVFSLVINSTIYFVALELKISHLFRFKDEQKHSVIIFLSLLLFLEDIWVGVSTKTKN